MPNWCDNDCQLSGQSDFIQELVDSEFNFEKIVPIPEGGIRQDLWGTKWQPSVEVLNFTKDEVKGTCVHALLLVVCLS